MPDNVDRNFEFAVGFALEFVLRAHSEYPEVGLVYSNFVRCDQYLNPQSVHKAKQITELDQSYYNFNAEISHFVTFKKKIYEKTSGIDPFLIQGCFAYRQ